MKPEELPLGFGMSLAMKPGALAAFANLSEKSKAEILQKVHSVSSKSEMHELVRSLTVVE